MASASGAARSLSPAAPGAAGDEGKEGKFDQYHKFWQEQGEKGDNGDLNDKVAQVAPEPPKLASQRAPTTMTGTRLGTSKCTQKCERFDISRRGRMPQPHITWVVL